MHVKISWNANVVGMGSESNVESVLSQWKQVHTPERCRLKERMLKKSLLLSLALPSSKKQGCCVTSSDTEMPWITYITN